VSRLGWAILGLIAVAGVLVGSLVSFGGARRTGAASTSAPMGALVIPVAGVAPAALRDSWGEARAGGLRGHHGVDIPAPGGTPVLATAAGTVEKLFASRLGGTTLYVRSPDRRWISYYAHQSGYAPGLHEGQAVRAGEPVGYVGDTGDAGPGNTHLHFGLERARPEAGWWQGEAIDPYPALAGGGVAARGGRR
jgi:murein DD-endopeptidase MepM/ murein hydrolase activator NlpD